jgi:UDP-glucose 4-epimerase
MPRWSERVLVTGGAGFLGSHLVDALVGRGARVTVVDNFQSGRWANLRAAADAVEIVEADVRDGERLAPLVARHDLVFHLAANADVPGSIRDPDHDFQTNVVGGYQVLRCCLAGSVTRVVFASSAAVYGEPRRLPLSEVHPTDPVSPYGAAKLAVEKLGFAYAASYGLPFTALRIFNCYGERQTRYVMHDLLRKLYRDSTQLEVLGTGEQVRDYCYVADVVQGFLRAARCPQAVGRAYNLAGGVGICIRDLVSLIVATVGLSAPRVTYTGQSWPGDISALVGDVARAREDLGFCPQTDLVEGLRRLHRWLATDLT